MGSSARRAARERHQYQRNEFLWRQQQRRADQHQRDLIRDAEQADTERERAADRIASIENRAVSDAAKAADEARRPYAAEEKRLLTQPRTVYAGATVSITSPVWVWHWKAVLPTGLARLLGIQRPGVGPIAALLPGGGLTPSMSMPDLIVAEKPELASDPEFVEWAMTVARIWKSEIETRYGVLGILRDDDWFARLTEAAGLTNSVTDTEQMQGAYGTYDRKTTLVSVPTITEVLIGRTGLTIVVAHRTGDTRERWGKSVPALRTGFKAAGTAAENLRVTEDSSGNLVLRFDDVDPFTGTVPESGEFDAARGRSLLGVTADGHEAWITWNGSSGMVVGGVPGSGKTASLLPVFAGMRGAAELHVFDGKSGFDLHPLRHIARTYDRSGDVSAPLETLRKMDELRSQRAEAMYSRAGANNYWNMEQKTRDRLGLKPVFVILDEVQTWTDTSGMDKEERGVAEEVIRLIRTLVQKARSVGIVVVLTTQKPDATTISTKIRDNAALKISFRVSTPEQAITILGRQAPGAPDPTDILMSTKGRGVMETEGQGTVLFQAGYTAPETLDAALADAEPVEDQCAVAARLLRQVEPKVEKPAEPVIEEKPVEAKKPEPQRPAPALADLPEDELWEELKRRQGTTRAEEPEVEPEPAAPEPKPAEVVETEEPEPDQTTTDDQDEEFTI